MKQALIVLCAAMLLQTAPAEAIWLDLSESQVQEALALGKVTYQRWVNENRPIDNADPDYIVDLGPEVGRAILYTQFSSLALESRRWLAINQALGPKQIEQILAGLRGQVQVLVWAVGPSRGFLHHWSARLEQGGVGRAPASADVFRGVPVPGAPDRWVAPAQYVFSLKDVDPTAPAALVLRDPGGREVRFHFDLARLR